MKLIDLSDPITEDMTLYPRWVREGVNSEITYTTYYNVSFGIAGWNEGSGDSFMDSAWIDNYSVSNQPIP